MVVVLAVVLYAVFSFGSFVKDVSEYVDAAKPEDYTIQIDSCEVSDFGILSAAGTITNHADRRLAYHLTIDFLDGEDAGLKVGSDILICSSGLNQGQSEAWSAGGNVAGDAPTTVQCKPGEVTYWTS